MAAVLQLRLSTLMIIFIFRISNSICQRFLYNDFNADFLVIFGHLKVVISTLPPTFTSRTLIYAGYVAYSSFGIAVGRAGLFQVTM